MLDSYLKGHEDDWQRLMVKAKVKQVMEDYPEAARAYEELLPLIDKDRDLEKKSKKEYTDEVHYLLSNVYIETDQLDKAIDVLKSLLAENPDNSTYNNDLGYVLADHDRDLDNAEKMIRKALEEDRKQRKWRRGGFGKRPRQRGLPGQPGMGPFQKEEPSRGQEIPPRSHERQGRRTAHRDLRSPRRRPSRPGRESRGGRRPEESDRPGSHSTSGEKHARPRWRKS